jgi:hypothetical protein
MAMMTYAWIPELAAIVVVMALCLAVAGCVSDTGAPAVTDQTNHQLRYYGGPKSPMWPSE